MLKASDLIDLDVTNIEREKVRVAELISLLGKEPIETKTRIANELLEIVVNRDERIARRSQAAFLLGTSSKTFGIAGAIGFSESLAKTLEVEYLSPTPTGIGISYRHGASNVIEADGLRAVFLQGLVFSILAIDRVLGGTVVEKLYNRVIDSKLRTWLASVSNISPSDRK